MAVKPSIKNGEIMTYRVEIDRGRCISCASCIEVCPDFFEFDDDDLSHLKGSERTDDNVDVLELEDADCTQDAAFGCPVNIIHVYEDGEMLI